MIGVSVPFPSTSAPSFESCLKKIEMLGIKAVEFQSLPPFASVIGVETNLVLSAHAPTVNLASSSESRVSECVNIIVRSIEVLDKIGGEILVLHPGYYAVNEEETFRRVVEGLEKVLEIMDSEGFNVRLGVENSGRKKQFGTLEEIFQLKAVFEEIVPVVDFGHLHARTNGRLRTEEDFREVLSLRPKYIHIACVDYEGGEEVRHQPLSTFQPDYRILARVIPEDVTVICESPEYEKDAVLFKGWVEHSKR